MGSTPQKLSGYTLVEIVIVTIVISVLAGLAIPRLTLVIERMRAEEGKELLLSLYGAQKRYALDNAGIYTDNISLLDIELKSSASFSAAEVFKPVLPLNLLARVTRTGNLYTLSIDEQARVSCNGAGAVCSSLGF